MKVIEHLKYVFYGVGAMLLVAAALTLPVGLGWLVFGEWIPQLMAVFPIGGGCLILMWCVGRLLFDPEWK